MKSNYEVRAQRFIEKIAPIVPKILNSSTIMRMREIVAQFNDENHRKVVVSKGLTRVALISSDYVIKIDYHRDVIFGDCESELHIYEIAKADGYDYMFAKITRYPYNGINYYIMPRINGINPDRYEEAWDYMDDNEREWCYEHNLIDLHSGNYGWHNKHIVIIDYAATDGATPSDDDSSDF